MSSSLTDRMSDIGFPVGLRFNGERVTREIAGDTTDTRWLKALVNPEAVTSVDTRGRAQVHDVAMHFAEADTITLTDSFLWNQDRYKVTEIEKPQHGMRRVLLQRVESERTEARVTRNLR